MRGKTVVGSRAPELWLALLTMALVGVPYLALGRSASWRPSGLVGHGQGAVGLVLMLWAAFGYAWRKPVDRVGPGRMRTWLRAHVFTGLVGPYLVLLHTGFAFRGLAGVVTLLTLVVVASGLVGRYAYTAAPRAIEAPEESGSGRWRAALAVWWLLHVPVSLATIALAVVHVAGALYYSTRIR